MSNNKKSTTTDVANKLVSMEFFKYLIAYWVVAVTIRASVWLFTGK